MALFNENYLRNLVQNQPLNESTRMMSESKQKTSFDIFLSHSFLDKQAVKGLYIELTSYGFSVYVDWIVDPHLDRNNVTKQTAKTIQQRLQSSKSLILAISENADLSKWMPWELGYVDGHTQLCALAPVVSNYNTKRTFERREFLLLYPYIKRAQNSQNQDKLWVVENGTNYIIFDDWMRSNKLFERDFNIDSL
ncbi:TIR domain-containing protein [Inquilinus sp. KBS0705]|nr:TIR domain-containing protein [Inquilinus sp. KBS0705]